MMGSIKTFLGQIRHRYRLGKKIHLDTYFTEVAELSQLENLKKPRRSDIINYLATLIDAQRYLEIGVRNPKKNFSRIACPNKFSVDPGIEFKENPVDFKMTSDAFFEKLKADTLTIKSDCKFDIIFIDGLHNSYQVENDILNSLDVISDDGFIILHDCNPPSEYHQREVHNFMNSPAKGFWNGTTWKAFYKFRHEQGLFSICFDCDWGIGVISKKQYPLFNTLSNPLENKFYEFSVLNEFRTEHLNLYDFNKWKSRIK